MADLTRDSDRVLSEARRLRDDNRAGGRHRRVAAQSIGRESRKLKTRHWAVKLRNIVIALFAIWVAAGVFGWIVSGIGFMGVMALIVASIVAVAVLGNYPKLKVPQRADLTRATDARQLVGRTELWLEAQRPALPAPAADMVGKIGVQLDALGLQLEGIDQNHPAAREIRTLVGETLPEMVDSYRRIPTHLRSEERAGATPDDQLAGGLGKISDELGRVTRQLAEGSLDDLAVKTRYLDYKYGEDIALPSPSIKDPA
ncbi:hypothetical protein GCM10011515_21380 [Tsuneonella deserti]|uniref:5-bromo-4-chloroindolyl phosphate hydrolysis protein n=1 Tax=Tsuneonella deserti TaxID=2035528 RepID=A0ABQ1SCA2_9SPHN|nr:hypothetical protein [Tsuneonella deserti]GGE01339.1 hypothetical protein GCM10011515_21380 [Tsuneonella deserti]